MSGMVVLLTMESQKMESQKIKKDCAHFNRGNRGRIVFIHEMPFHANFSAD